MPSSTYSIITNSRKRKILVVNRLFHTSQTHELEQEDFDAIFVNINYRSYEETRLAMRWLSPTRVGKCFLKPWFAQSDLQESMYNASDLFDGFCENPNDEVFADFIEEVYRNIEKYEIQQEINLSLDTTSKILANLIKFSLSRGQLTYTNYAIKGVASGFPERYMAMYDNMETLRLDERLRFSHKLEELGYAVRQRFVNRVYVCRECGDSHQLFIECCPKCGSSDIRQESMLHHFRCANISPESSYFQEGSLVCPKCHRTLRHIGVDYDRPATVYTCTCGNTFMTSAMKVICTHCRNQATPDELMPIDVCEYKFTPAGIKAFATDEGIFQIESTDIYAGRSTFDNFCESIRLFSTMPSYANSTIFVFRYHYVYGGEQEDAQIFDVMRNIMMQNATMKLTSQDNSFYALLIAHNDRIDAEHRHAKNSLDRIFSELSEDNDQFDTRWLKTYKFTRDDDPEEFVKEISEAIEEKTLEDLHEQIEPTTDPEA